MLRSLIFAAAALTTFSIISAAEPKVAERWAVLVGVDDYANANDLQYCGADQTALRDRLIASGFRRENVILLHDKAEQSKHRPSQRNIEEQLRLIIGSAEADDLLVVGFSGHGVSLAGKSYLCPNDARLGDPTTLISLDGVYDQLRGCAARFKWVLVDACRNDPTLGGGRSLSATEGTKQLARSLQELRLPEGVVLLNSCAPGEISWEEQTFGHGVYMHYVLEAMDGAGDTDADGAVSLNELQRYASGRTKSYVIDKFNTAQRPFFRSEGESETMDFALLPVGGNALPSVTPPNRNNAPPGNTITNSMGMRFSLIPAGEFQMGSLNDDVDADEGEKPQHPVRITKPFFLGIHEVTRGQFGRFVSAENYQTEVERDGKGGFGVDDAGKWEQKPEYSWRNSSFAQTDDHPVMNVTWNDAQEFCRWLSRKEGKTYSLPSEAQWEYACRAGTMSKHYHGDEPEGLTTIGNLADDTARAQFPTWTTINARDGFVFTAPVGRFKPNNFGLYDMTGNVWEWCDDWYDVEYYAKSRVDDPAGFTTGTNRVLRGGGWANPHMYCRSAARYGSTPSNRCGDLGFRAALLP